MVSSFHIKTTIRVGPKARDAFNAWVDEHGTSDTAKVPAYFDQGFLDPTFDPADIDPTKDKESPSRNTWHIKDNGALVDCAEKFHGAITTLHWCIQEFFAPRGVKLNGTVVGVNTEYGMLYIYNVRDNVIEIDMENTRAYLAEYRALWKRYEETGEEGDFCPWQEMMDQIVVDLDLAVTKIGSRGTGLPTTIRRPAGTFRMNYTISFLGEGGVGKTTWIAKMKTEIFNKKYVATVGHEVHPYAVNTNHGQILLNLFDYAGQEKYGGGLPTRPSHATILMFDFTSTHSYKQLDFWHKKCAEEQVFIVGNKIDATSSRVVQNPTFHTEHGLPYLELSAKTGSAADLLTPVLRRLTGHEDLVIEGN